jgi:hypothetical protein
LTPDQLEQEGEALQAIYDKIVEGCSTLPYMATKHLARTITILYDHADELREEEAARSLREANADRRYHRSHS